VLPGGNAFQRPSNLDNHRASTTLGFGTWEHYHRRLWIGHFPSHVQISKIKFMPR